MALENDPSAKMQIRSLGELLHPGACMSCGNGNFEGNYIDLGVFFDYEGHMYLCSTCATQVGETLGMFKSEEHIAMVVQANEAVQLAENLQMELQNVRAELDASRVLLNSAYIRGRSGDLPNQGPSTEEPTESGSVNVTSEGESEVTEPDSSAGSSDTTGTQPSNGSTKRIFSE